MEKVPVFFALVDEAVAEYFFLAEQVELRQDEEGTQRSEEPASIVYESRGEIMTKFSVIHTVEIDQEVLCRGSDRNRAGPLQVIFFVSESLRLALLNARGESR